MNAGPAMYTPWHIKNGSQLIRLPVKRTRQIELKKQHGCGGNRCVLRREMDHDTKPDAIAMERSARAGSPSEQFGAASARGVSTCIHSYIVAGLHH